MKHYTIAEIKESYTQKRDWEKQFPVSYYIFRPVSFIVASLVSRLTNSAPAIAWAGLGVGLGASWLLLRLADYGPWPGIAGLALFALLDAVDGNMARVTKTVTLYGKMLDGMLGRLAEGIYMPALACGLYFEASRHGADSLFSALQNSGAAGASWSTVAAGFIALCAMLYSGIIETTFDNLSLQNGNRPAAEVTAKIGSSRFRGNIFYSVFINLNAFNVQVLLLTAAAVYGRRGLAAYVYSLAAYYLLRLMVVFVYYMRRASDELQ